MTFAVASADTSLPPRLVGCLSLRAVYQSQRPSHGAASFRGSFSVSFLAPYSLVSCFIQNIFMFPLCPGMRPESLTKKAARIHSTGSRKRGPPANLSRLDETHTNSSNTFFLCVFFCFYLLVFTLPASFPRERMLVFHPLPPKQTNKQKLGLWFCWRWNQLKSAL